MNEALVNHEIVSKIRQGQASYFGKNIFEFIFS